MCTVFFAVFGTAKDITETIVRASGIPIQRSKIKIKIQMKIFLVSQREYSFTPSEGKNAGIEMTGVEYIGYLPTGVPIKFTSQNTEHKVHRGYIGYREEGAEDISLDTLLFDGVVKYREVLDPSDA